MKQKVVLISVIIIAIVLIGAVVFWQQWKNDTNQERSNEFMGQVQEITNTTIIAKGYFVIKGQANPPVDALNKNQVSIMIDGNTKITRTILTYPDPKILGTDKAFSVKDMSPKDETGSLELLRKDKKRSDITLTATSDKNINNQTNFLAKEIKYTVLAP